MSKADTIREWIKHEIYEGASGGGAPLAALDALLAENQRLEKAYAQACTNLATIRPSGIEGATIGDDADRYHDALLAGWGGIEGWDGREALAGDAE